MKKLFLLLVFCTVARISARAQHPFYYKLDDESGLPSNEVYQVIQDNFGYIWIGCDAGLYRYDGISFTAFTNAKQNSRSMSNLMLDKNGNIWCQNFTGQVFKTSGDSLILFRDFSKHCRQYPHFTLDHKNRLWVATDSSIMVFDSNRKKIHEIKSREQQGAIKGIWIEIEFDGASTIYVISGSGYGLLINCNDPHFTTRTFQTPIEFAAKNLLLYLNNEMHIYSEQNPKRRYKLASLKNGIITNSKEQEPEGLNGINYMLNQTGPNEIWLGTSNGAVLLNNKFERLTKFGVLFNDQKISSVFKDNESNYWFTSLQEGIFIVPDIHLTVYNNSNSSLTDNNISTLNLYDDHTLLIGNYLGELFSLNVQTNEILPISAHIHSSYRAVRKIIPTGKNSFLTSRGPFCKLENGKESFIKEISNVRDFIYHENKIYFVGSDRLGISTIEQPISNSKPSILLKKGGKCVAFDTLNSIVYYGTTDGLLKYENGKFTEVRFNKQHIYAIELFFEDNTLWIGSSNFGFLELRNKSTATKSEFSSLIRGISVRCFKKTKTHLIVSTEAGLTIVSLEDKQPKFLDKYDGLSFFEINKIEVVNESVFLATIKGLVKLPLNTSGFNNKAPGIKLGNIKINGVTLKYNDFINLDYGKQNLEINFMGASMRSRGSFSYKYRLNGFEQKWHLSKSESPYTNYPFLPAGSFTFEVFTVNEDGVESLKPATLKINVNSPYWQKWWFYLLIALVTAIVVTLFFQQRIKYLNRKSVIKNKIILSQLTALKAQMNPHFMYNILNSIQDLILQKDIKSTNYYLSRFSNLMRKVLDASDDNEILLSEEIEILELYLELEKLRFGNEFNYVVTIDATVDPARIYIPSMIIQPYVENAMKHGLLHKPGEKKLTLDFTRTGTAIRCVVSDNGVGIEKAMEIKKRSPIQHKSFAGKATEKRLSLINSSRQEPIELKISSLNAGTEYPGTKIEIIIPA
ncbi:MAG TPA: histidine kinase [Flavobacteriales bacterium]|nr:histidine kinase [Flavobacteriales bacterium]